MRSLDNHHLSNSSTSTFSSSPRRSSLAAPTHYSSSDKLRRKGGTSSVVSSDSGKPSISRSSNSAVEKTRAAETSIINTQNPGKTRATTTTKATAAPVIAPALTTVTASCRPLTLPRITATATTASILATQRPPTLSSSLRTPLRPRDHNARNNSSVKIVPTTRPAKTNDMPFDKSSGMAARQQPQMPSLGAAASKAMGRAPLTPKIATRSNTPQVVTPVARRMRAGGDSSSSTAGGERIGERVGGGALKDEFASPLSGFLASNVTPRSGSRQSRVESTSSTPNGTPNADKHDWDSRSGLGISGAAIEAEQLRKQAVSFSPVSEALSRGDGGNTGESKFFYASDARSAPQPLQQRPLSVQPKPSTFFYANGGVVGGNKVASPTVTAPTPVLGSTTQDVKSKFFYANGTPDPQPGLKPTLSGPGSTVSTSSRMTTARTAISTPAVGYGVAQRPASPIKQPSVQSLKGATLASPVIGRSPIASPPVVAPSTTAKRRISLDTSSRARSHSRSGSSTIAEPPAAIKVLSYASSGESSPSSTANPAMTMASIIQAAEDLAETEESRSDAMYNDLHSPTKSTHSTDQLNELVANARRERKVQDLEITNASLEAINRTLERQLRKQTTELRRFRRLSRSGRFSLASSIDSRVPSGSIPNLPGVESLDLTDLSEEGEDDEDRDSLDDSEEPSDTDSASVAESLSSSVREAREEKQRRRDEKRLQLDLSKHRQLLVDSQKMNQSLKRCLNWTEELIKEGRKALEYHVRVSDVEIGGRVLAPHLEDEEGEGDVTLHALGFEADGEDMATGKSTMTGQGLGEGESLSAGLEPPAWSKGPQDRDSGIELPPDGG
jgi:hypothetical protein